MATISLIIPGSVPVDVWRDGTLLLAGGARRYADTIVALRPTLGVAPDAEPEPSGWATLSQAWALLRVVYRADLLACDVDLPWVDQPAGAL